MKKVKLSYKQSGVDTELGDEASKILYEASKKSWKNRKGTIGEVILPFDDFSGVRAIDVSGLPKGTFLGIGFDGIGTKVEIAERMDKFDTLGFDLVAMVTDDAIVRGAEPVLVGSILDVNRLQKGKKSFISKVKELADGYFKAALDANVAIFNGELAELGSRVSGFSDFSVNWGASVLWFSNNEKMFTGFEIKAGDKILALREDGFRSNGLSLVRKVFEKSFGKNWHNKKLKKQKLGDLVLTPTKIYAKLVSEMFGGLKQKKLVDLHGVCHITGGGIFGKLERVLRPAGLGANLDDLFPVPEVMLKAIELGNIDDKEAYKTWCMGQGMFLILPEKEVKKALAICDRYKIQAKICGEVTKNKKISLISRGYFKNGQRIE